MDEQRNIRHSGNKTKDGLSLAPSDTIVAIILKRLIKVQYIIVQKSKALLSFTETLFENINPDYPKDHLLFMCACLCVCVGTDQACCRVPCGTDIQVGTDVL